MINWRTVEDSIKTAENNHEGPSNEKQTDLNNDIAIEEIENAINRTRTSNKSMDADGVHPKMLENIGPHFQILLHILFNKTLRSMIWP